MKINAQEMVLLNRRNLKNSESAPQTTTETTVSNPEETLNALKLQGMNNLTFQGVNVAAAKKIGQKVLIPLVIAAGALAAQSCDEFNHEPIKIPVEQPKDTTVIKIETETNVETNVTVENNTDALLALLTQWMNSSSANNEATAKLIQQLLEEIAALREDLNNGLGDIKAQGEQLYNLQLQAFDLMKMSYANDLEMTAKLTNIEVRLEEIKAAVEAGNLSYAEATEEIKKLLEGISGKLDGILGAINDMKSHLETLVAQGELNNTQNDLISTKLENLTLLLELGQLDNAKGFLELSGIANEILNQLIENNKYDAEALVQLNSVQAQLAEILIAVQKDEMDVQTGFDKINEILGQISGQLDNIIASLQGELNKANTLLNELVEQGLVDIDQMQSLQAQVTNLLELVESGQVKEAEAYAAIYDINKAILEQLLVNNIQNTGVQAQLYAIQVELGNIENAIKNGTLSYEEGNKQIQELIGNLQTELEGINGSLDEIIASLQGELNKVNTLLNELVEQGHVDIAQMQSLQAQVTNLVELVEKGQIDQAKALAEIFDINKAILEQMIENNRYNNAFKDVIANLEQDMADIENAIKNQDISVEVGTEQLQVLIENLSAQLEKIQATLDSILKEVSVGFGMVDAYNKTFESNWNKLMNILENFDGDLSELINGQKDIKFYLSEQVKQLDEIKKLIQDLDVSNGGDGTGTSGITVDELKDMLKGLGDYYYNSFENFVKNNIPNNAKIEDLLASIDKKLDNLQQPINYADDLAKITSLLEQLAARPDYSEKLDKIIELLEQFECNCQCGGSNEGIVGDLEDLLQ